MLLPQTLFLRKLHIIYLVICIYMYYTNKYIYVLIIYY